MSHFTTVFSHELLNYANMNSVPNEKQLFPVGSRRLIYSAQHEFFLICVLSVTASLPCGRYFLLCALF